MLNDVDILDFLSHEGWLAIQQELDNLLIDLRDKAARSREDHLLELGKLLGAERAMQIIQMTKARMRKERNK